MALNISGLTYKEQLDLQERERQRQEQSYKNQQLAGMTSMNSTASGLYGTSATSSSSAWVNAQNIYSSTSYVPSLDLSGMKTLEAGWRYIRWRGHTKDEVEAYVVPIMGLITRGSELLYVVCDVRPTIDAHGAPWFLGVLSPDMTYDKDEWQVKADKAYYEYHAAQVAATLLKSANAGQAQSAR